MHKRYRLLKYPWHTGHDYELAKLPHDFFYLTSTPREWALQHRAIPDSIAWIPSVKTVETDAMILHVDQWSFQEASKRHLFLKYRDLYDGPKIVINHGSNMVDGCSSETMANMIDGCFMVCNSSTARDTWNIEPSLFIRHGMSVDEWPSTDYAIHNILVVQAHQAIHGAYRNHDGVAAAEARVPITWVGRDKSFNSFQMFRHYLQRSSILLQPSYASPNPP